MRTWKALGAPAVPFVKIGNRGGSVIHVSQLYSLLGLDLPAEYGARALAWDVLTMMESWLAIVRPLNEAQFFAPTPARNRSARDLLVDTFEKVVKALDSPSSGRYMVVVDSEEVATTIVDVPTATQYAEITIGRWRDFLLEHFGDDDSEGSALRDSVTVWEIGFGKRKEKGTVSFGVILSFLRNHTAMHLRQVSTALDRERIAHVDDGLDSMAGLNLPDDVYGAGADKLGRLDHQQLVM